MSSIQVSNQKLKHGAQIDVYSLDIGVGRQPGFAEFSADAALLDALNIDSSAKTSEILCRKRRKRKIRVN